MCRGREIAQGDFHVAERDMSRHVARRVAEIDRQWTAVATVERDVSQKIQTFESFAIYRAPFFTTVVSVAGL